MTMTHIYFLQKQFTSEIIHNWRNCTGICFHCSKVIHWAKKLLLPMTAGNVLCRLDMEGTQEKRLLNFVNIRYNRPSNFLLHWKVLQLFWACKSKIDTQTSQRNCGWFSRQPYVSAVGWYYILLCLWWS